jgi:glycosyltransferase involved in cell wall biosynthesis
MGLCVVAPDFPTMNEYITHGINGLLYDPKNPSPLDFSKVEELGKAARKTVENGWVYWNKIRNDLFVFLSEPLPQCHYNRIHPLIIIKGKSIGYLRKLFRLFKNIF